MCGRLHLIKFFISYKYETNIPVLFNLGMPIPLSLATGRYLRYLLEPIASRDDGLARWVPGASLGRPAGAAGG